MALPSTRRKTTRTSKDPRYRSGLEREAADQLTEAGLSFGYESDRIDYLRPAKPCKYTPDFVLTKTDGTKMYIETKGRFDTQDRQKQLLIKDQHPDLDIRLVFQNANQRIGKASRTTYAKWAEAKGFLWADKGIIPDEWLDECRSKDASALP